MPGIIAGSSVQTCDLWNCVASRKNKTRVRVVVVASASVVLGIVGNSVNLLMDYVGVQSLWFVDLILLWDSVQCKQASVDHLGFSAVR